MEDDVSRLLHEAGTVKHATVAKRITIVMCKQEYTQQM